MDNYLDFGFEVKTGDVEETGVFRGYGSTFGGKPDAHGDVVLPGAFSKTLEAGGRNGTGVAFLWQHRSEEPIGIWRELVEDSKGLKVVGQLAMDVPTAQKAHALMKLGAIRGLSIGYDAIVKEIDEKKKIRYLKEVSLWEISLVTFPCNTRATVAVVKAISGAKTERELENILRDAGVSKTAAQYLVGMCKPSLQESGTVSEGGMSGILHTLKKVNSDLEGIPCY